MHPTSGRLRELIGRLDSLVAPPSLVDLADAMRDAGLVDVSYRLFMFGTIGVHVGTKL